MNLIEEQILKEKMKKLPNVELIRKLQNLLNKKQTLPEDELKEKDNELNNMNEK